MLGKKSVLPATVLVIATVLLPLRPHTEQATAAPSPPGLTLTLPDYGKLKDADMEAATDRMGLQQRSIVGSLLRRVEDLNAPLPARVEAVVALIYFRDRGVASSLVRHINLKDTRLHPRFELRWPRDGYVVRNVLPSFGIDAEQAIFKRLENPADELTDETLQGFAEVLRAIERPFRYARLKTLDRRDEAKDPLVRARYEQLLAALKKVRD